MIDSLGAGGFEPSSSPAERRAQFDLRRNFGRRIGVLEDSTPGEPNGFEDRSDCTLSFDNGTRTLTLTGTYTFFARGKEFTKPGDSFQISDDEGGHYVYYGADGRLAEYTSFDEDLIGQDCFVAYIYWDTTNNEAIPRALCEQHGSSMSAITHSYLHNTRGSAYGDGILPAAVSVDGSGAANDSARFTTTSGQIWDEDIRHTILAHGSTDAIPWLYRSGASGVWRMDDGSEYVARKGTTYAYWNEWTGATWQLTEAGNNDYVLAHVFALSGTNETNGGVVILAGQAVYSTVVLAREGAETEIAELSTDGIPFPEFVAVATFIVQTASSYSNAVASRIVSTASGDEYVDWRGDSFAGGGGSGSETILSDSDPQPVDASTASPGTSPEASRADHVHTYDAEPWTAITSFSNSWVNYGGGAFNDAAYRKIGDIVYVRGFIKSGTMNADAFVLPVGFRPPKDNRYATVANSAFAQVAITAGGGVKPITGSNAWFSIDGIQFSVTS